MIFSERVFGLTRKIPKGRVSTYGIIVKKIGSNGYTSFKPGEPLEPKLAIAMKQKKTIN